MSSVRIDDVAAMRTAVHHLLHQGHQDIVMITGVEDEADFGFASSRCRREGYVDAMLTAGLADGIDFVSADTYGIEGGAAAMSALMDQPTLPTAVVAEYDELAIGAVRTLRRASIAVPGRMSVVGVDGHEMASVVDLTTVAQPVQEQGAVAARLLLDTLSDPETGPTEVVLPTRLLARQHRHALVPAILVGPGLTPPHSAAAARTLSKEVRTVRWWPSPRRRCRRRSAEPPAPRACRP